MAQADATLIGTIAVVTLWAVGLGFSLALAVTLKSDSDGEGVLEAHRLNDECFLLLFGATTSSGLHTERDLDERGEKTLTCLVCQERHVDVCVYGTLPTHIHMYINTDCK